jgi:transposase-like protein
MLVNVHFSNKFAKGTSLLFLFYRLRWYAQGNGGYITGFKLTKNEEYNLLPKLRELGWISRNRIVNYRNLCNKNKCYAQWVDISEKDILSLDAFKGFLVSVCEASFLRSSYRRRNGLVKTASYRDKMYTRDRYNPGEPSWFDTKKIRNGVYQGRVSNQTIAGVMGISETTVTNWRKHSGNKYDYKKIVSKIPEHSFLPEKNFFYSRKSMSFVSVDLTITTYVRVFTIRGIYTLKDSIPIQIN